MISSRPPSTNYTINSRPVWNISQKKMWALWLVEYIVLHITNSLKVFLISGYRLLLLCCLYGKLWLFTLYNVLLSSLALSKNILGKVYFASLFLGLQCMVRAIRQWQYSMFWHRSPLPHDKLHGGSRECCQRPLNCKSITVDMINLLILQHDSVIYKGHT